MFTHNIIKKFLLSSFLAAGLAVSSAADTVPINESEPRICEWGCHGWWFPSLDEIFSRSMIIRPEIHYQSSMNFKESSKTYTVNVILPDIEKKDISINVINNVLVIAAERKNIEKTKDKTQQLYSSYHQSIVLPENADTDKIDATYKKGSVTITIPKTGKKTAKKVLIR